MDRNPNSNSHVPAFVLLIFLVGAAVMSVVSLKDTAGSDQEASWSSIISGKWAKLYEPKYNKELPHSSPSRDFWGALSFSVFKEGREGVVVGENDWLFTSEEFDYSRGAEAYAMANIEYVQGVHAQLASKDIDLVIALVPSKARIYNEHLGNLEIPYSIQGAYQRYFHEFTGRGIHVSNILSVFETLQSDMPLFLKTDTHWTPEGAAIAAAQIASDIQDITAKLDTAAFETTYEGQQEVEGDLKKFIPLGAMEEKLGPEDEFIALAETTPVEEPVSEDALFGTQGFDVVLIGTSYSADPRWNFVGALKQAMGTDVLNLAKEGQGPFKTMEEFLASQTFADQPPQLIIWEIPERYMHMRFIPGER